MKREKMKVYFCSIGGFLSLRVIQQEAPRREINIPIDEMNDLMEAEFFQLHVPNYFELIYNFKGETNGQEDL